MKYYYVLSIIADNSLEILQRISIVFSRNRLLICSLNFKDSVDKIKSEFKVEASAEKRTMDRVIMQLKKIIDISQVTIESQKEL